MTASLKDVQVALYKMLKNCNWSADRDYKTGSENEPIQFYIDALSNSTEFDLLLGYFSSAAINLLSTGFAKFISNGGKMRLVINHLLSTLDKELIERSKTIGNSGIVFDLNDIVALNFTLSEYDKHFFECLAYMIATERIEIKIIKPKHGKGISHYKSGVFCDGEDRIGYKASCNFTLYGLSENLEELEAFLSWENGRSNKLINKQISLIKSYFEETEKDVEYLESDQIQAVIVNHFGSKDIDELLIQESDLLTKKAALQKNPKILKSINKISNEIALLRRTPKFPFSEGPRDYQIDAYVSWKSNSEKGIFAMATGTGKTLTALNCLLNSYREINYYRAIIIVPTISLVDQWRKECLRFNFRNVITVSSESNWSESISFYSTANYFIDTSFIIIVTYSSFPRPKFQSYFKNLPSDTILVADEAHNLGSDTFKGLLSSIHLLRRIGLSATPSRKYDDLGNEVIEEFFSDKAPYVCSFTMEKALSLGWLCQYLYYPHVVYLKDDEQVEYLKISKQLFAFIDPTTKTYIKSSVVERLLLKRKRIIHKAANKLAEFKKILFSEFHNRGNLRYTLVYVPEGKEQKIDQSDISVEELEDVDLINEFTRAVRDIDESVIVRMYTSTSRDRADILNSFEAGNTHVLTSMKCLDEGVDIPRSQLAIFCSSTGNPRQFIQRRGRVLRTHKEKTHAVIHDLVVVPQHFPDESSFEMERNILKSELQRVVDFSNLSMNKTEAYSTLKELLDYYNLNLNEIY